MPVINGLTDLCHPRKLADVLTIREAFGTEVGKRCFVGDGNNVSGSLITVSAMLNEIHSCMPKGYQLDSSWLEQVINVTQKLQSNKHQT